MRTEDDATLLRTYARDRTEVAFAELVRRHVDFVYAAALRQVNGDAHLAQDVVQLVFTDLARKAAKLAGYRVLAGWLFTSTRYAAANAVRTEARRRIREEEAHRMKTQNDDNAASLDWDQVRPVIDEALADLGDRDRDAILLRFFQGLDFPAVGTRLALTDNAARMRVDRALDRLRAALGKRGITSTSAALGLALGANAALAAPAGLASSATGAALAGVATGGMAAATITFMNLTKLQVGMAGAVLAGGTGLFLVQEQEAKRLRSEWAALSADAPAGAEIERLRSANAELERAALNASAIEVNEAEWEKLLAEAAAVQERVERDARLARKSARNAAPSSRAAGETVGVRQLDSAPRLTSQRPPQYPAVMRKLNMSGDVVVDFVIDATGKVVEAKVKESTNAGFELAALEAVQAWQFSPGLKGGRPVNTRVTQRLQFNAAGNAASVPDWF